MPNAFSRSARSVGPAKTPRFGLARVLSKMGTCSRSEAERWIRDGRVSIDGRIERDPQFPTLSERYRIAIDGVDVEAAKHVYVMFNKPRGLVVSATDEQGRDTVYTALATAGFPWLGPVGRLDKASEGLLLLSNDTTWAAGITDPATHLDKIYHVQVAGRPDDSALTKMQQGIEDAGDLLKAKRAVLLRAGEKNAWVEIVLDEGRNRHIRRLLAALGFDVMRLIRVAVGSLALGELAKNQWRQLTVEEVRNLDTRVVSRNTRS